MFVVPKGVEHCPLAEEETHILLIEPTGTANTGNVETAAVQRCPSLGSSTGPTEDTFLVYGGGTGSSPFERGPVWRYVAKNGLRSPDVPAVAEFRKAVEAAVKQQQKTAKP
jgi:hypothetical protein